MLLRVKEKREVSMGKISKDKWISIAIALIAIFLLAVFIVVVLWGSGVIGVDTHEREMEIEITRRALNELNIQSNNVKLELISIDYPEWLEWEFWVYVMRVDDRAYEVDVLRNKDEIHLVDVIREIGGKIKFQ